VRPFSIIFAPTKKMKNQSQHNVQEKIDGAATIPGSLSVVIRPIITLPIFSVVIGISALISLLSIIILG